jgi:uncharacterized coiled-coil DUF342 family protein
VRIDHHDIQEMRVLEERLNALREERDYLWCRIECEDPDAEKYREEIKKVVEEIRNVETELDIVGGFNGE